MAVDYDTWLMSGPGGPHDDYCDCLRPYCEACFPLGQCRHRGCNEGGEHKCEVCDKVLCSHHVLQTHTGTFCNHGLTPIMMLICQKCKEECGKEDLEQGLIHTEEPCSRSLPSLELPLCWPSSWLAGSTTPVKAASGAGWPPSI